MMSTPTVDLTSTDFPPELPIEAARSPLHVMAGGKIVVGNSRVRLASVIHEYRQGSTAEGILEAYEALELPDIHETIAYYLRHREAVDEYLNRLHQEEEAIRKEYEAKHPKIGREELIRRFEERKRAEAATKDQADASAGQ